MPASQASQCQQMHPAFFIHSLALITSITQKQLCSMQVSASIEVGLVACCFSADGCKVWQHQADCTF